MYSPLSSKTEGKLINRLQANFAISWPDEVIWQIINFLQKKKGKTQEFYKV